MNKFDNVDDSEINARVHAILCCVDSEIPDYCVDPSFSWPVIEKYRLNIYPSEGPDFMPWVAAKNAIIVTDKRPLRAAMVLFLLLHDK